MLFRSEIVKHFKMNSTVVSIALLVVFVCTLSSACKYDSDCGPNGNCQNSLCIAPAVQGYPVVQPGYVQPGQVVPAGGYVQQGQVVPAGGYVQPSGVQPVVVLQPTVLQNLGCNRHSDCLGHGIYYECNKKRQCVASDHKICRRDEDCKKNWINRRCLNDRCSLI